MKEEIIPQSELKIEPTTDKAMRKYNKIDYHTRMKLIDNIVNKQCALVKASEELGIRPSTAKYIIKSYLKYKRVFVKKDQIQQVERTKRMEKYKDLTQKILQSQSTLPLPLPQPNIVYVYYTFPNTMFNQTFTY